MVKNFRDFVTLDDAASANVLALTTQSESAVNQVYNVASGTSISISKLFNTVRDLLAEKTRDCCGGTVYSTH